MPVSRYTRTAKYELGTRSGVGNATTIIRRAIANGQLGYTERVFRDGERLDTIAGEVYNDGSYWWAIAAASDIGWGMQVPGGTLLKIPRIEKVLELVG